MTYEEYEKIKKLEELLKSGTITQEEFDKEKEKIINNEPKVAPPQNTVAENTRQPLMGIEENLALAKRRGKSRLLRPGITRQEREEYHELLKILGLGLEDRLTSKVGLLSGGQRQALTLLMATLKKPQLLLLDEHTAALDPKTAAKVLEITDMIVTRDHLTTMMITHNMRDAITHGNRLIMMWEGKIILDIQGEEKKKLIKQQLMEKFAEIACKQVESDRILLS